MKALQHYFLLQFLGRARRSNCIRTRRTVKKGRHGGKKTHSKSCGETATGKKSVPGKGPPPANAEKGSHL